MVVAHHLREGLANALPQASSFVVGAAGVDIFFVLSGVVITLAMQQHTRSPGAFFMRRTFKGAPLYARVFATYVYKLLQEGFNIEVFIEGGRSRTGKLLSPKTGLLSILLDAYRNGACDDLILAPIFIGYDKVPEEKAYLHELEGGAKKPESLSQVIKARKVLKKRFGKIYIEFHDPLSLKDLLERNQLDLNTMDKDAMSAFCRNIGHRAINAINRIINCGLQRLYPSTPSTPSTPFIPSSP